MKCSSVLFVQFISIMGNKCLWYPQRQCVVGDTTLSQACVYSSIHTTVTERHLCHVQTTDAPFIGFSLRTVCSFLKAMCKYKDALLNSYYFNGSNIIIQPEILVSCQCLTKANYYDGQKQTHQDNKNMKIKKLQYKMYFLNVGLS